MEAERPAADRRLILRPIPLLILLLAWTIQAHGLGRDARFHPDEALFMTFARNAAVNGDWMLPGPLDKPPFSLYMQAISLVFVGIHPLENGVLDLDVYRGEFAGRLPNSFAALLLVAVTMRLTFPIGGKGAAWLAGLLLATSPFLAAFGATAFTDLWMILFGMLALGSAMQKKGLWSGFFFALAFSSKPQALYFLPLILALMFSWRWVMLRFAASALAGLSLLLAWDVARGETSLFVLASANNVPAEAWFSLDHFFERAGLWLSHAQFFFGPGWLTGLLLLFLALLAANRTFAGRMNPRVALLLVWVIGISLIHLLVPFNLYDRYLLLILPPLAVCLGWAVRPVIVGRNRVAILAIIVFFGLMSLGSAWEAAEERLPIGADLGKHNGIDLLAESINAKAVAAVIYDHWLGWELGYYLGQWNNKRRVYYPDPDSLARGAQDLPETAPRYLIAPDDVTVEAWVLALLRAGFSVVEEQRIARFILYRVVPPR